MNRDEEIVGLSDVEGEGDDSINRLRGEIQNQREIQSQLGEVQKELKKTQDKLWKTNKIVSKQAGVIDKLNKLHRDIQSQAGRNIGGDELLEVLRDNFCIR